MVAVIESPFIAALVACIGGPPRARPACILANRTIDLPAEVSTANEEDAPAKRASQLIQRDFVFHPPRGRKESGRPELVALSSPIVKLHPPDRGSRAVTLGPHSFTAAALYPGFAAAANSAATSPSATARRSNFLGSQWPPTVAGALTGPEASATRNLPNSKDAATTADGAAPRKRKLSAKGLAARKRQGHILAFSEASSQVSALV
jgi:hypothetical protein